MTSDDEQVLTFDDSNGELTIETNDFSYDGTSWTLRLSQTSILSNVVGLNVATYEIPVEFIDVCQNSVLQAPEFIVS